MRQDCVRRGFVLQLSARPPHARPQRNTVINVRSEAGCLHRCRICLDLRDPSVMGIVNVELPDAIYNSSRELLWRQYVIA